MHIDRAATQMVEKIRDRCDTPEVARKLVGVSDISFQADESEDKRMDFWRRVKRRLEAERAKGGLPNAVINGAEEAVDEVLKNPDWRRD